MTRGVWWPPRAALFGLALLAGGCAATGDRPAPTPPPAVTPATTPVPSARAARPAFVPDTRPSADAEAVLATIPEPLTAAERTQPAPPPPVPSSAQTPASTPVVPPEATTTPPSPAQSAAPQAPPAAAPAPPAVPADCWRLQVRAPADRTVADATRTAAESQLEVPFVVEPEQGLFKVRSRDCHARATAERLRDRAAASGFDGAFLIRPVRP